MLQTHNNVRPVSADLDSLRILSRFPGYGKSEDLAAVSASDLTAKQFHKEYVMKHRPCRIIGAARHWPAYTRWGSVDYLKGKTLDSDVVPVRKGTLAEFVMDADPPLRLMLSERNKSLATEIPFHRFLEESAHPPAEQFVIHSWPLNVGTTLGELRKDVQEFAFLPSPSRARFYVPYRAFFYAGSYTDWHYHMADETLMTQVVGAKEVLILRPDQQTWETVWPIIRKTGYLDNPDFDTFPGLRDLHVYRTTVEPGDALYIPVFWWHAVESIGHSLGVTVAATFATSLHINTDLRYPAARHLCKSLMLTRQAPLVVLGVSYWALRLLVSALRRA